MARTLDANTTTAVGADITRPLFLVSMAFDSIVYYSSRDQRTWDSKTWLAASMKVTNPTSENPTITIFNESTTFGQTVLADGTAGRAISIWQAYGMTSGYTDPMLIFTGEMGESQIGKNVVIKCKRNSTVLTPRLYVTEPTFNHLPKAGARIVTANNQIITLEGS